VGAIVVLGPGGVGGFVSAALARAGDEVVLIAREETAAVIGARGIEVESRLLGAFHAEPRVVTELTEEADVLMVATKATGLEAALARVHRAPKLVVPLLNGLEHLTLLRERFGDEHVLGGVIRVESERPEPGRILQRSPSARVDIAGSDPRGLGLARRLEAAGVEVRTGESESRVMWSKLARLNALSLTTSASGQPLGFIRSDPRWRSALDGAVNETVATANAEGAGLDPAATLQELEQAHPELVSSMQRDLAAGREPELDAIAGAVLRAAGRHGLRCPTVAWLASQVAERAGIPAPGVDRV
jgi:2-dehydropantoate 2-reductase